MKEKLKKIINKDNYIVLKMIILLIMSVVFSFALEHIFFISRYTYYSWDRVVIFTGICLFIGFHLIFKIDKIYDFIYKKRYILAGLFLFTIVLLGYSGSSITTYDSVIQGENTQSSFKPIFGTQRSIRSDEWAVNTPLVFSQQNVQGESYPYFNMNIRGTSTDMFTIINSPVKDIVSIGKPFNLGYILFGNRVGLSFWWYGRLIALILIAFEFGMILTKKKKIISLLGSLLITFAPATQWWYSNFIADILIFGLLALVLVELYMTTKKDWVRYLSVIGIGFSAVSYIFIFYPSWLISFGYVFLALFIWLVIKNKKDFKFHKKDLIIIFLVLIFVLFLFFRFYNISKEALNLVMNTDYPGERFELGGNGGIVTIFSSLYEVFFPYKDVGNPCENSSMISFFPLPTIIALIVLIKNKGKRRKELAKFLVPLLLVVALFSIWVFFKSPVIIAKITLLYMATSIRVAVALSFTQTLLIIYLLGNVNKEDKILNKRSTVFLVPIITSVLIYIGIRTAPENYFILKLIIPSFVMTFIVTYLMFNLNKENHKKILITFFIAITIYSGFTVNPLIKGIDVIYEKPLAKEVQKITSNNSEALWLVDKVNFTVPNYMVANGARVINSTNYYPNKELYIKIFGKEKSEEINFRKIYNRYAHVSIEIVNNESKLELLYFDSIKISINTNKLRELNVKYIVSTRKLEELNSNSVRFISLYDENGMNIYEVEY